MHIAVDVTCVYFYLDRKGCCYNSCDANRRSFQSTKTVVPGHLLKLWWNNNEGYVKEFRITLGGSIRNIRSSRLFGWEPSRPSIFELHDFEAG